MLPFYAFADVAVGCAAAWAFRRRPRLTGVAIVALVASLAVTSASAWPDYLPFFNAAVGSPEQGLAHLADSNVDWGQDVNALASWQRANPRVPLYVDLFTAVDPAHYGVRCQWLWVPGPDGRPRLNRPAGPCVVAISATHIAGVGSSRDQRRFAADLISRQPPQAVLHGTIYLYDYHP